MKTLASFTSHRGRYLFDRHRFCDSLIEYGLMPQKRVIALNRAFGALSEKHVETVIVAETEESYWVDVVKTGGIGLNLRIPKKGLVGRYSFGESVHGISLHAS